MKFTFNQAYKYGRGNGKSKKDLKTLKHAMNGGNIYLYVFNQGYFSSFEWDDLYQQGWVQSYGFSENDIRESIPERVDDWCGVMDNEVELSNDSIEILLFSDDTLVGIAALNDVIELGALSDDDNNSYMELAKVCIGDNYQGQGLGKKLMEGIYMNFQNRDFLLHDATANNIGCNLYVKFFQNKGYYSYIIMHDDELCQFNLSECLEISDARNDFNNADFDRDNSFYFSQDYQGNYQDQELKQCLNYKNY